MARRRRRSSRRFDAGAYWASRPWCVVCYERKTRTQAVCHVCRRAGRRASAPVPTTSPAPVWPTARVVVEGPPVRLAVRAAIRATPRPGTRCAYCHGAAGGSFVVCLGCRTVLHPDCRSMLKACPTLGCTGSRRSAPALGEPGSVAGESADTGSVAGVALLVVLAGIVFAWVAFS